MTEEIIALDRALQAHNGSVIVTIEVPSQITGVHTTRKILVWQLGHDDFQIVAIHSEPYQSYYAEQETFRIRGQRGRDRKVEELGCPADSDEWLNAIEH